MITDELREFMRGADGYELWCPRHKAELAAIAGRIDAEHRAALEKLAAQLDETSDMREFCGRIEQAANNREDVTIWGVDYTPLPVDADGVPVRVGDVMEWPTTGETFEVVGIGDGTLFYVGSGCDVCADWTGASTKRHHHKPTVEDVLDEFANAVLGCDNTEESVQRVIAEYAAKLRLAGDVE